MNYAEIGTEEGTYVNYGQVGVHSILNGRSYRHRSSGKPAIVHIADEPGNTGRLGQWVFRTDDLNATTTTTTTTTGTPTGVQLQQPNYV